MDKRKQQQVIYLLLGDPEMQDLAMGALPAEKLVDIAKNMDKEKQKQIFLLLIQDPQMQAVAMESLGIPPGLANAAGGLLGGLASSGETAGPPTDLVPTLDDLKALKFTEASGSSADKLVGKKE
jgi:hypothetical protein